MNRPASAGTGNASRDIDSPQLPARVRNAILDQQDASERLICWVQLAVVALFGTLYFTAPQAAPEYVEFAMVPIALGLYFAFTLARLAAIYRGRPKDWLPYLSVIADMALLFGLIWSFHIQYMQPPAFYLKAPTLLYVFIFIALRALRFEARFVIFAGVVAAIGWSILAYYSVADENGMKMITRDYVLYLTSNHVLIGAEIDKIVSILTVTAIIAVAIGRARRLLIRAIAEQAAASDLARFFSPEVAEQITTSETQLNVGEGEAHDATILFCDVRGFTVYAHAVTPSELMAALAEYQSQLVPVIQRHGGAIDKFMGDGIMATFGAARASDTHAADALRAIDDIMSAAAAWNAERESRNLPPLPVGAAASSGRVIVGAVGDESRLEYTVIGDAVNVAAKLEKHTKAEGVRALTDRDTFVMAGTQGYAPPTEPETRPGRAVEGIDDPVNLVVMAV
jgi:adenylate cyclase